MSGPTQFADLNALLGELVTGVRAALGDEVVGVYLQGSFAVGDADEHSDVDFLAVTRSPIADVTPLRVLHARLHAPAGWASHWRARTRRWESCEAWSARARRGGTSTTAPPT